MHPCPCAHCLPAAQAAKLPHSLPWSASVLDFATPSQARQCIWPYRVHLFVDYGLVVRFRLPSTPPLDDAVAFSYGQPVLCPTGTFTPLLVRTLRRSRAGSPSRPVSSWQPLFRRGSEDRPTMFMFQSGLPSLGMLLVLVVLLGLHVSLAFWGLLSEAGAAG